MKRFLLVTAAAIAMPLAAFAQTTSGTMSPSMSTGSNDTPASKAIGGTVTQANPNGVPPPTAPGVAAMSASPAPSGQTAKLSLQDTHFIDTAAVAGLSEVNDGQLAVVKGDTSVKAIGNRMIADHTLVNNQLTALATQEGVTPPVVVDAKHAAIHAQLKTLSGGSFDRRYLSTELTGHEMTISAFKAEASTGSDPQLKAFAEKTLPQLEMHLTMIKAAIK